MPKVNTTIKQAVDAVREHDLDRVTDGVFLCCCERWFPTPQDYAAHLTDALEALAEYKPRTLITPKLLKDVAEAFSSAPSGKRNAAAAEVIGCSTHAASYYVQRARREGFLGPADKRRGEA